MVALSLLGEIREPSESRQRSGVVPQVSVWQGLRLWLVALLPLERVQQGEV
jgi:hypothetical protein